MLVAAKNMKVSVNRLVADPEFYLYNYRVGSDTSDFLIVNEHLLEIAPFIDSRIEPYARGQFSVPTAQLSELVRNQPGPLPPRHFIFHHAFVCSTLLARCLSRSEAFFSLKEPQILRRLSDIKYERATGSLEPRPLPRSWARTVDMHIRLLAKRYSHGRAIVIKASNVSNNLQEDVLMHSPGSRMLYMYGNLPNFLVSILKKPLDTQQRIGSLLHRVLSYGDFSARYPQFSDVESLTLLQRGALLWLVSNEAFLKHAETNNDGQIRSLDVETLLQTPDKMLQRVCSHFGHDTPASELARMSAADVMSVHAKDPRQPYNSEQRVRERHDVLSHHGQDIGQVQRWIEPLNAELQITSRLTALSV